MAEEAPRRTRRTGTSSTPPDRGAARSGGRDGRSEAASRPDVYLDVPKLEVEHVGLEVEDLRAKVSLQAEVLDLLKLNVGVDAQLGKVALEIDGVQAEATLKVRLDEVARIIDRVLDTIDRNPQIIETVVRSAASAVRDVGSGVGEAVGEVGSAAGETVGELGQQAGGAVGELGQQAGRTVGQVGEQAGEAVGDTAGEVTSGGDEAAGSAAEAAAGDISEDASSGRASSGGRSRSGSTSRSARRATG